MSDSHQNQSSIYNWQINSNNSSLDMKLNNTNNMQFSKVSPLPKPDFSSLEKKESNFVYKQKGSYKKPKSNYPESPMKSPNQKFFTPVKMSVKNLYGENKNTCRKLNFGGDEDSKVERKFDNYTEGFRPRGKSLLEKLEEEDKNEEITPDSFKKNLMKNNLNKKFNESGSKMDIDDETNADFKSNYFDQVSTPNPFDLSKKTSKISIDLDLNPVKFEREFDVIKTLDTGAFGIVYKCYNKFDKKIYAVKKSKKHSSKFDYNQAKFFINDISNYYNDILSKFCVKYFESWMEEELFDNSGTENHLFITQEYCHNGDMLDYLEKIENAKLQFTENFYWDLIFEMMCGLQFIHSCEYIHLDIKPGNFLIDESGCVKLGDFGLSKKANLKRNEDVFEGDSAYLAPEFFGKFNNSIEQKDSVTNKCDVFSLGLTILEIFGRVEMPQNGVLWKTIRSENFTIPQEFIKNSNISMSERMISLIHSMLDINPLTRPSIASILQNPFFTEINTRFQQLFKGEYIRSFDPSLNMNFNIEVEMFDKCNNKRSNSYKVII